ncbi:MAG: hypothetical protein M1830_001869 [Pleopsidium flavum]|nr:MAG: hypothetical protein M1830_001869 [Pleopsidium flavum]
MAEEAARRSSRESRHFVETSFFDTIVPHASEIDLENALRSSIVDEDAEDSSLVPSIMQRQALLFDELTNVYVVLRTSYLEETVLKSYISRLVIRIEAHAVSPQLQSQLKQDGQQDGRGSQIKDLIFSDSVKETEDPVIVLQGSEDESDEVDDRYILVFWKLKAFLSRPRIRMQSPMVVFTVSAILRPAMQVDGNTNAQEYLPSAVPAEANLLESFQDDPSLGGVVPHLPTSRVSRIAPATHAAKEIPRPLRLHPQRSIRAIHAASARLRYSRLNSYNIKPTVLASLEFEVAPFVGCEISLKKVDMRLLGGFIEPLTVGPNLTPPITCQPKDQIVLLYRFTTDEDLDTGSPSTLNAKALDIFITATAMVSADCRPQLSMQWRTSIDFSTPLNPSFGGPSQLLQRTHRPSSLPVPSALGNVPALATTAASDARTLLHEPDSVPSSDATLGRQRAYSIGEVGVTVTFCGPTNVYVGESFKWEVVAVNRSSKVRRLALVALPKWRRDTRKHLSKPSSSSAGGREENSPADAVVDENIVYAMQKNAVMEPSKLVSLSTDDVRIGPLHPGACLTVELKFVALVSGALYIEAVRIVDVGTNETTYVRDLPDIVAWPKVTE